MANYLARIEARKLRQKGRSVRDIARELNISKSTASVWTRDIILSLEQLEALRQQNIRGGEKGRILGALKQKRERMKRIELGVQKGMEVTGVISRRELLLIGTALYWAEGEKKQRRLSFCNSDPKLVQLMLTWFFLCLNIPIEQLSCYIGINEIHRYREETVKEYWSNLTKIPLTQFTKTSFKKVKNKKVFANTEEHYGTLTVKVKAPGQMYYDILGLIESIYVRVAQW